jgi:hypothetical protein
MLPEFLNALSLLVRIALSSRARSDRRISMGERGNVPAESTVRVVTRCPALSRVVVVMRWPALSLTSTL